MIQEINKTQKILEQLNCFELKDIYLLTYLAMDSKYLVVEGIYGKQFADKFWKLYYPEDSFL